MIRTLQGPAGTSRCAIVIGVDNPGILATLESAASGAAEVADWLAAEGYDVTLLSDADRSPVAAADVFAAVRAYVDKQTYDVLVLYFSGHGFRSNAVRDLWLLSDAAANPQASINLDASVELARDSGIANVVVISDACRSQPTGFGTRHLGTQIFPIRIGNFASSTIDHIMSTAPGAVSWEAVLDDSGRKRSLLTHCLRSIYATAAEGVARDVSVGGVTKKVVTNRMLLKVMPAAMKEAIRAAKLQIVKQTPDLNIPSDDEFFIASVKPSGPEPGGGPEGVARIEESDWLSISPPTPAAIGAQSRAMKLRGARLTIADVTVRDVAKFETSTGIAVRGARARAVRAMTGISVDSFPHEADSVPGAVVRVGNALNVPQAATIAIQF